ncbi:MAG: nucleotidyltransferase family protein [Dehalococcoidia bacterium]|jgi:predicted nucleotidyltransferase
MAKQNAITIDDIKKVLYQHMEELERDYCAKNIGIFGSHAVGSQRINSDIDILVEFSQPVGFIKFLELEKHLENLLGKRVDLVTKDALKPYMGQRILEEVKYL